MIATNVQVNADWNATSGSGQILNKPTLGSIALQDADNVFINGGTISVNELSVINGTSTLDLINAGQVNALGFDAGGGLITNVQSPSSNTDAATKGYVDSIVGTQSDWNATTGVAFILNKPTLGTLSEQDADNVNIRGTIAGNIVADDLSAQTISLVGSATILTIDMQDGSMSNVWEILASTYVDENDLGAHIDGFKIRQVPDPTDSGDATNKGYVDGGFVAKTGTDSSPINSFRALTQTEFDGITPNGNTVYLITAPTGKIYYGNNLIIG
jgi:hypothetical protein